MLYVKFPLIWSSNCYVCADTSGSIVLLNIIKYFHMSGISFAWPGKNTHSV